MNRFSGLVGSKLITMKKKTLVFVSFVMVIGSFNHIKAQQFSTFIESTGGKTEFCVNQSFALVGNTINGTGIFIDQRWNADNGIDMQTFGNVASMKASSPGTYQISYSVKDDNNIEASAVISVNILQAPYAELIINQGIFSLLNERNSGFVSYKWLRDGKEVESQKNNEVIYSGRYRVVLTDKNGCVYTTNTITIK
jgi:hypothetical protein